MRTATRLAAAALAAALATASPSSPQPLAAATQARVVGRVTDGRGAPVPGASAALAPSGAAAASGADGGYALAGPPGAATLSFSDPAYGALPPTPLDLAGDRSLSPSLPPAGDLIQNGGFEAGPSPAGWAAAGALPVAADGEPLTGARSLRIGQGCAAPCLTPPETIDLPRGYLAGPYLFDLLAGPDGALHLFWGELEGGPPQVHTFYQRRSPAGAWSAPASVGYGRPTVVLGPQGTLHVLLSNAYTVYQPVSLSYTELPPGGAWSAGEPLGSSESPVFFGFVQGQLWLLTSCSEYIYCVADNPNGAFLRVRPAGQPWPARVTVPLDMLAAAPRPGGMLAAVWRTAAGGYVASLAADGTVGAPHLLLPQLQPGDELHGLDLRAWRGGALRAIWSDGAAVFAAEERPDGSFSAPRELGPGLSPSVAAGADGALHAVWSDGATLFAIDELADGSLSAPRELGPGVAPGLWAGADGTLHLRYQPSPAAQDHAYATRPPGGAWSAPVPIADAGDLIALGPDGRLFMLSLVSGFPDATWTLALRSTQVAAAAAEGTATQSVAVPAGAHAPTLSLRYALRGAAPASGSRLDVEVAGTPALELSGGAEWGLAWVDMAPWAGSTVSVTLRLRQAAGAPAASALVDDVSLGEWLTPVVAGAAPADPRQPFGELVIQGENFVGTPEVRLGGRALAVAAAGPTELRAAIPPGLAPGAYDLRVTNPGGQRALLPGLIVGFRSSLPVVAR